MEVVEYRTPLSRALESNNLSKRASCAPNPSSQTSSLKDLAMVNKQIGSCALVLNVICEHGRVRGFEPTQSNVIRTSTEPYLIKDAHNLVRGQRRCDG